MTSSSKVDRCLICYEEVYRDADNRVLFCSSRTDNNFVVDVNSGDVGDCDDTIKDKCNNDLICSSSPSKGKEKLIDKQLHTIFILRELLKIPQALIKQYLTNSDGENPDCWIELCTMCNESVGVAREIFSEIIEASHRFKSIQEHVIKKVKCSYKISRTCSSIAEVSCPTGKRRMFNVNKDDISQFITDGCRKFVSSYDYGRFSDANKTGDMFAEKALRKLKKGTEFMEANVIKPVEVEVGVDVSNDDDDLNEAFTQDMECGDADCSPMSFYEHLGGEDSIAVEEANASKEDEEQEVNPKPSRRINKKFGRKNSTGTTKKSESKCDPNLKPEGAFYSESGRVNYRCQVENCEKVLTSKRGFALHMQSHSGVPRPSRTFPCPECGKLYASNTGLYLHKKSVHEKEPKNYHRQDAQKRKRKIWKDGLVKNPFQCPQCAFNTPFKICLENHVKRIHENQYRMYCDICGKGHISKFDFKSHQAHVHFICSVDDCKLTFSGTEELRQHQLNVHGKEIDVFTCYECGKQFKLLKYLNKHKHIHEQQRLNSGECSTGSGQFICDQCGKQCVSKEYLYYHNWHTHRKGRKEKDVIPRSPESSALDVNDY